MGPVGNNYQRPRALTDYQPSWKSRPKHRAFVPGDTVFIIGSTGRHSVIAEVTSTGARCFGSSLFHHFSRLVLL
jgi:hypothetical protein